MFVNDNCEFISNNFKKQPEHILNSIDKWKAFYPDLEERVAITHKEVVAKFNSFNKVTESLKLFGLAY